MRRELEQEELFDISAEDLQRREWVNMPEFIQENQEPFKTVFVHFANREDMEEFSRIVDQNITLYTQSIWYPAAEIKKYSDKRYIDES